MVRTALAGIAYGAGNRPVTQASSLTCKQLQPWLGSLLMDTLACEATALAEHDLVDLWLELARDVIEHAKTTMIGTLAHRKIGRPIDQAEVANAEISTRVGCALD